MAVVLVLGDLFPEDDIYALEDDFTPITAQNFIPEPTPIPEKRILEQSFTLSTRQEIPVNQRKITKIIAFFDDGSYLFDDIHINIYVVYK